MRLRVGGAIMNILVTAGPTREAIDPVRFIANRSSGKMGYAAAEAAAARGHAVRLISGPVCLHPPDKVTTVAVISAADMLMAVREHVAWCDVLIMAAAVADWRPAAVRDTKIKKGGRAMTLDLVPTEDVLRSIAPCKQHRLFVGFAAETSALEENADAKLASKPLDYIVANDVSRTDAGFEADTNRAVLLGAGGRREVWPLMSKRAMAERILDVIEAAVALR